MTTKRTGTRKCLLNIIVALTLITFFATWQTQAAEKEVQRSSVLDFTPTQLLPEKTKNEEVGIRVRLEHGKIDPNIMIVSVPNKNYKLKVTLKMDEKGNFASIEPLYWSKDAILIKSGHV